jgi:hypothetical protein
VSAFPVQHRLGGVGLRGQGAGVVQRFGAHRVDGDGIERGRHVNLQVVWAAVARTFA